MIAALLVMLVLLCLVLEGFFSGAETAIVSVSKPQVRARAQWGDARARVVDALLAQPSRLLATTLVGTNLSVVTGTSIATLLISRFTPPEWESAVTTAVMAPLIIVFGELLPKSIGRGNAEGYALRAGGTLLLAQRVMKPLVAFVSALSTGALRLVGLKSADTNPYVSREEVEVLADISAEAGVITPVELSMIRRVFDLNKTTLASEMVPLVNIVSVPATASLADVLRLAEKTTYSRFPVYEDRADNIAGLVNIVDVVDAAAKADRPLDRVDIADLIDRTVPYLPETKLVSAMLREQPGTRAPAVLVVDEYGGVTGMVTMQNLAEAVVGDMALERPDERALVVEHRDGLECEGRVDVDVIGERLGVTFDKDGYDTVAGLVLKIAGRVAQQGEEFTYRGLKLTVVRATRRRIIRVRVSKG